ncbi:MAG: EcsC family protein [Candidatus Acidiferrales bacterium]
MGKPNSGSEAGEMLRRAIYSGLSRAYNGVKLDSTAYLHHLRRAHRLPIVSYRDMFLLPVAAIDHVADQTISASKKIAALEGAGVGMGGMLTVLPDISFLSIIAMRMLQKLSLIYGFEYSTEEEVIELWIAAGTAAGLDLGRDLLEKEVIERFVPRVMERVAARMGAEIAEKWTARLIPILSGAIGGALNYYFIREWGRRAKMHFRARHLAQRQFELDAPSVRTFNPPKPLLPA